MTAADLIFKLTPEQQAERAARLAANLIGAQPPDPQQAPILADLSALGVDVHSVWSQFLRPEDAPEIFDVLMNHLQRGGYPARVMQGLALKFARKEAYPYRPQLRALYVAAQPGPYKDALASAVAASAQKKRVGALIELLGRAELGDSRILLMRRIKRLGGAPGLAAVTALVDDPELGKEARILLKLRPQW
jgi:hypothetical protein